MTIPKRDQYMNTNFPLDINISKYNSGICKFYQYEYALIIISTIINQSKTPLTIENTVLPYSDFWN